MKNIFITAAIVGVAAAALILYYFRENDADEALDDISDAAGNAHRTMNKYIGRVERRTENALGDGWS